jgi:hypothetical protein
MPFHPAISTEAGNIISTVHSEINGICASHKIAMTERIKPRIFPV